MVEDKRRVYVEERKLMGVWDYVWQVIWLERKGAGERGVRE